MGYARSRGPFLMWFTCGFEHIDHAIKDDDMAVGISAGAGRYTALCGATVNVASMICPLVDVALHARTPCWRSRGIHLRGSPLFLPKQTAVAATVTTPQVPSRPATGYSAASHRAVVAGTEPGTEARSPQSRSFDVSHSSMPLRRVGRQNFQHARVVQRPAYQRVPDD